MLVEKSAKHARKECTTSAAGLIESRHRRLFTAAAMEIVHGDVEIDFAAGRFNTKDHGFSVHAAGKAGFAHVNLRREDLETKTLVVKKRDAVADDHVGEFADGFTNGLLALRQFRAGQLARHAHGDVRSEIQNDAAFDVALDGDQRGDAFAAIGILVHGKVTDPCGGL